MTVERFANVVAMMQSIDGLKEAGVRRGTDG